MIFITVGTEKFHFDRLIKTVDGAAETHQIAEKKLFAQIGQGIYKPKTFAFEKFISFDKMVECIKKADIIICHAGVGSTILSLNLGKIPIIFPRRQELGEHFDNHQMEFARKMEVMQKVIVAYKEDELIYKINNYHKILTDLKSRTEKSKQEMVKYLKKICEIS